MSTKKIICHPYNALRSTFTTSQYLRQRQKVTQKTVTKQLFLIVAAFLSMKITIEYLRLQRRPTYKKKLFYMNIMVILLLSDFLSFVLFQIVSVSPLIPSFSLKNLFPKFDARNFVLQKYFIHFFKFRHCIYFTRSRSVHFIYNIHDISTINNINFLLF